ncbi:hypothetical protein EZV62_025162 [Acer yangbiense]|uniref:Uncharacterized protein n=1 Tax=Acer yangbiense TaxID=1000413 RepID=A0A5C7GXR1_9ROSI|nr:hypothetical protein EZV62_025162 [Acer yangbiense]
MKKPKINGLVMLLVKEMSVLDSKLVTVINLWQRLLLYQIINPGPLTRKLMDSPLEPTLTDDSSSEKSEREQKSTVAVVKDYIFKPSGSIHIIHSQATAYARLAESEAVKCGSSKSSVDKVHKSNRSTRTSFQDVMTFHHSTLQHNQIQFAVNWTPNRSMVEKV